MAETFWIIEALRVLLSGGSWADLMARPGFVTTLFVLATLVPASVIVWGIGFGDWNETPLARHFGFGAAEPERSLGEIDADLKQYETWRDLDGDGKPNF